MTVDMVLFSRCDPTMKKELWHWRYRSRATGRMCRTLLPISAEEAAMYLDAERVEGTKLVFEVAQPPIEDTAPWTYSRRPE